MARAGTMPFHPDFWATASIQKMVFENGRFLCLGSELKLAWCVCVAAPRAEAEKGYVARPLLWRCAPHRRRRQCGALPRAPTLIRTLSIIVLPGELCS